MQPEAALVLSGLQAWQHNTSEAHSQPGTFCRSPPTAHRQQRSHLDCTDIYLKQELNLATAHLIKFHLKLFEWGTRGAQVIQHLAHHIKVRCLLRLLRPRDGLIVQVSKRIMTILWPALLLGSILERLQMIAYAFSAAQE